MGYKVMGTTEQVMQGYLPRKGLEGPFNFSGRILYYDAKAGEYWDPKSDFYVDRYEMTQLHERLMGALGWRG